ncbi:MAG: AAA family ATPase [Gammaproteobacteria bacterium]
MLDDVLTPIGIEDPSSVMSAFQNAGNEMLVRIRDIVTNPYKKKTARTWGIVDAAKMIGVSAPTLRKMESEESILGEANRNENNRRAYTLERINQCRNLFQTRYKRGSGSQPICIAITNFKGGCAKTTTVAHLAQKCALEGLRVLMIDLDPQGSASFVCGGLIPDLELEYEDTICTALMENPEDILKVIRKTHFDGLDIIPANLALQDAELGLPNSELNNVKTLGSAAFRLRNCINLIKDRYDVIIFDCGPNLGILTINALTAANSILIPIPPNMFDYASFVMLTGTLKTLFESLKIKKFDFFRILLSKHSGSGEAANVENMLRKQFGGYVLSNHMCETIEIARATNDLSTVYEISKPRGSRDAFRRAIDHLDAVNKEIIGHFKSIWESEAKASSQQILEEAVV